MFYKQDIGPELLGPSVDVSIILRRKKKATFSCLLSGNPKAYVTALLSSALSEKGDS